MIMAAASAHPRLAQVAGSMSARTTMATTPAIAAPRRLFEIPAIRARQRPRRPAPSSETTVRGEVREVASQASAPIASAGRIMSLRPTTSSC
jgi:hypothetical protein